MRLCCLCWQPKKHIKVVSPSVRPNVCIDHELRHDAICLSHSNSKPGQTLGESHFKLEIRKGLHSKHLQALWHSSLHLTGDPSNLAVPPELPKAREKVEAAGLSKSIFISFEYVRMVDRLQHLEDGSMAPMTARKINLPRLPLRPASVPARAQSPIPETGRPQAKALAGGMSRGDEGIGNVCPSWERMSRARARSYPILSHYAQTPQPPTCAFS